MYLESALSTSNLSSPHLSSLLPGFSTHVQRLSEKEEGESRAEGSLPKGSRTEGFFVKLTVVLEFGHVLLALGILFWSSWLKACFGFVFWKYLIKWQGSLTCLLNSFAEETCIFWAQLHICDKEIAIIWAICYYFFLKQSFLKIFCKGRTIIYKVKPF